MGKITIEDFERIEIRVGTVIRAKDFPEARKPAYKLWIDFGKYGLRSRAPRSQNYIRRMISSGSR